MAKAKYKFNPFTGKFDIALDYTDDLALCALLDGSNQPFTGNLEISKADPEVRLTDTGNDEYARLTRADTSNLFEIKNRALSVGGTGSAISFNANTDRVTIPNNAAYNVGTGDFAISLWLKRDSIGATARIINRFQVSTTKGFSVYLSAANSLFFYIDDDISSAAVNIGTINNTNVHHLLILADRSGNVSLVYDGGAGGSGAISGVTGDIDTAEPVYLGTHASYAQGMIGWIQEVCIFNKLLDGTEQAREWNSGAGYYHYGTEDGLILLAHCMEGSGVNTLEEMVPQSCVITSGDWVTGQVLQPGVVSESSGVQGYDAVDSGDLGIWEFGANNRPTLINGSVVKQYINGVLVGQFEADGTFSVPAGYEAKVTADGDIPNKKYVDDADLLRLLLTGGTLAGNLLTNSDIEITDATKGIILTSPDTTRWRITIDNAGVLVTTSL